MRKEETIAHKIRHALHLKRALILVWQSAPGWTIANFALLFVQGVLPLLSLYLLKLIVDAVTAGLGAPDKVAAFRLVAVLIVLLGIVVLITGLCRSIASLLIEAQSQTVTDHVFDVLHAKSAEVDLEYYENSKYYDTFHRAQQEAPYRPNRIVNGLAQIGQSGISLLGVACLLFSFHWSVVVILFAAAIPGTLVRLKYSNKLYRWQRERTPMERRSWYYHQMLTTDEHAKELRLFGLGALIIKRFRDLRLRLRKEKIQIAGKRSMAELAAQTAATLAVFGSYAFIAFRAVHGMITLGDFVMFFQAIQRGLGFLQEILGSLASLYEDNLFLSNLDEFLDLKPKVAEPAQPRPMPRPLQSGIAFDHVHFRYPDSARPVLEDISLIIRPGEHVALVGENGSGKTTLVKLLCRLYDPDKGAVIVDGIDLREFGTAALRQEISVVFQDYSHYQLTARENIWFGDASLPQEDKRIIAAASSSGADQVIERLPKGYETTLGRWFEDGEELSIGEWQKIALARAFMRDAQVIVLDEPTSALDPRAEYGFYKKFRELAKGRTAVIISHRFSTVRMADRIYVLENGRITESGTHDELVRSGRTYAELFNTQAQYYT